MPELRPDREQPEFQGKKLDRVRVERYDSQPDYTHGRMLFKSNQLCFTLEDEKREVKVKHETRVPQGIYKLGLRNSGGFNSRYAKKFASMGDDWHQGMLCVYNVRSTWEIKLDDMSFQYILIHIGNDDRDSSGCLIVGTKAVEGKNFISGSTDAYKRMYPVLRDSILASPDGYIEIEYKDLG